MQGNQVQALPLKKPGMLRLNYSDRRNNWLKIQYSIFYLCCYDESLYSLMLSYLQNLLDIYILHCDSLLLSKTGYLQTLPTMSNLHQWCGRFLRSIPCSNLYNL